MSLTGRTRVVVAVAVLSAAGFTSAGPAAAQAPRTRLHRRVCGLASRNQARCQARVVTEDDGLTPLSTVDPDASAYTPADLRAAYSLPASIAGTGRTVAIVDAFDNPNAESDLAAYRSRFGLPPCTALSGCFRKVNQAGNPAPLPLADVSWGQEIDLDIEMASAACPNCHIVLVEADTPTWSDLVTAVDTAANTVHATAISNSYGDSEFSGETSASYEGHYDHPGSAITVSAGDGGYGVAFPAASRYVTAVGGTTLNRSTTATRGWSETAWMGSGSGCSAYVPKPAWQTDTACGMRTVADVATVADPNTGVAIYDTYGSLPGAGWYVFGGTSVGAPIVAGIYALAAGPSGPGDVSTLYSHRRSLNDVTSGSNGSCSVAYLCTAQGGYDGPTGLGSPRAVRAFVPKSSPQSLVANPGFETGAFSPWSTVGAAPGPILSGHAHTGTYAARIGTVGPGAAEPPGDSSVTQSVVIPASATQATLSFWYLPGSRDSVSNDWQEATIRTSSGSTPVQVFRTASNSRKWTRVTFDATAYRGQAIQLWFTVHQDGRGNPTYMYLDDVSLSVT